MSWFGRNCKLIYHNQLNTSIPHKVVICVCEVRAHSQNFKHNVVLLMYTVLYIRSPELTQTFGGKTTESLHPLTQERSLKLLMPGSHLCFGD